MNFKERFLKNKWEILLVLLLLLISGISHGYNMFHFPYYENDEGTYMSQAWSLVTEGKLAPYTYWYDHAPAGWMLIALWTKLTKGFFTFGMSVNSGRVLMLILHILSSALLYYIARRLSGTKLAGVIAVLIFSLSPLGIYFQRRVLLDNIMIFWVLGSLAILLKEKLKLSHIIMSGVLFGIAVLTKENAIFFLPAFLYAVYTLSNTMHRSFAMVKWLIISGSIISLYFLYALLKGELFPVGMFGNYAPHVSLLETLRFQSSRSGGSFFEPETSAFWLFFSEWIATDALIIFGGIAATIALALLYAKYRRFEFMITLLFSSLFWAFLVRGGIVISFYIIPLIPILALTISQVICWAVSFLPRFRIAGLYAGSAVMIIGLLVGAYIMHFNTSYGHKPFSTDQTLAQIKAIEWIRNNVPEKTVIAIDDYGFVDLNAPNNPSGNIYHNAEWYWKIDHDDAVKLGLLHNDFENIEIIALTPQMERDLRKENFELLDQAIGNAQPIERFLDAGWGVEMWYPRSSRQILNRSWESYKEHYISDTGRTIDPVQSDSTISEAQGYALLRAVMMDDKETFDRVWKWTSENLQQDSLLFAWKLSNLPNGRKIELGNATDADQDIVLALAFAAKQWNELTYLTEAHQILNAMWNANIARYNGIPYLTAGNWAHNEKIITINPSYLSPAHYRIFAELDTAHPWNEIVASSYDILERCTFADLDTGNGVLPPEWCTLNLDSGEIVDSVPPQPVGSLYGFNSFRIPWRIAMDYEWYNDHRAVQYLQKLTFLNNEWLTKKVLTATYTHDGKTWDEYESTAAYGGNIGYFIIINRLAAQDIYRDKILAKFYEDATQSYWDDPNNYYTQNWAWFGTALYSGNLPNLWAENR